MAEDRDLFLDEDTRVDFTRRAEDREMVALATEPRDTPQYSPEDFAVDGKPGQSLKDFLEAQTPVDEVPQQDVQPEPKTEAAPEPEKPRFYQKDDGSSILVENTNKGLRAVLSTGIPGVQNEVFYGQTEEELWMNVAAGKINATKKIREQERRLKLEAVEAPSALVEPSSPEISDDLTADEMVKLKTMMADNPAEALKWYIQRTTGSKPQELGRKVERGVEAAQNLTSEEVAREFMRIRPEYFNHDDNLYLLAALLSKRHLRITMTKESYDRLFSRLVSEGHFTVNNLTSAYDELAASGLLVTAPEEEEAELEPTPARVVKPVQAEAAPSTDERIVRTVRRPRAGYGVRTSDTHNVRTETTPKPPSAEDLDDLPTDQLNELLKGVTKLRRQQQGRR